MAACFMANSTDPQICGEKARKASKKTVKKASYQFPHSDSKTASVDFLPLEGDLSRELSETKPQQNNATVLYIGRIPHGFYEKEMEGFAVSLVVLDFLVSKFDKTGGKSKAIEYDNFIECCVTVKGLTEKFKEKDTKEFCSGSQGDYLCHSKKAWGC
ncbi:hypothetical protein PTKIN_Ptkin02bG0104900 [Pterospermum kingtungense]